MHEFFVCNIDNLAEEIRQLYNDLEKEDFEGYRAKFDEKGWFVTDHYQVVREHFLDQFGCERQGVQFKDKINVAAFFKLAYGGHNDNAINRIREVLYGLNLEWVEKSKGYVHEAK